MNNSPCLSNSDDSKCQGFEDRYTERTGHYTVTIHDEDCPRNPSRVAESWEDELDRQRDNRLTEAGIP